LPLIPLGIFSFNRSLNESTSKGETVILIWVLRFSIALLRMVLFRILFSQGLDELIKAYFAIPVMICKGKYGLDVLIRKTSYPQRSG